MIDIWDILEASILILGTFAIIMQFPKQRFRFYHGSAIYMLRVSRWIRAYPSLITIIGTGSIILSAVYYDLESIVIVTLFYGTVLFFSQILRRTGPFPQLAFDTQYKNSEYGDSGDLGVQYEFGLRNIGDGPLIGAFGQYRIYDGEFNNVAESWKVIPEMDRQSFKLDPGDIEEFTIEVDSVSVGDDPDYYIALRIMPRPQFRDLTLWWTTPLGTSERTGR